MNDPFRFKASFPTCYNNSNSKLRFQNQSLVYEMEASFSNCYYIRKADTLK